MAKVKALAMALSAVAAAADALSELAQVLESEYTATAEQEQPAPVNEVEQPAPVEEQEQPTQPAYEESKAEPEQPAPAPEKPKKAAKVKKVSIEDIRAKMAAKIKENKRNEVQALLIKHSASKLSEVSEDEYPELLGELEEI